MSEAGSVEWHEVQRMAADAFSVWVSGSEPQWAERAWSMLAGAGLADYSNEVEHCQAMIRLFALAGIYHDFRGLAWDEEWAACYELWVDEDILDRFRMGQLTVENGRIVALGNLSPIMKEALKVADAYLKAQIKGLGDVPGEVLNRIQPVFYMDLINAAIRTMGLE